MTGGWMASWVEEEFERRREEEFRATLRRPDALPLPDEEPTASLRERLTRVVIGWRTRVPTNAPSHAPARSPSHAQAIRRGDDEATVA